MEHSNNVNVLADVVQATHHQVDIRCGATPGIQCSCISLMSICWRIFKTIARLDSDDLDRILQNGDCLYKSLSIFRLLGVEHLPVELNICGQVVRIELLENKTGETTLNTYLISLTEIVAVLIQSLCKKCANTDFFLVRTFPYLI